MASTEQFLLASSTIVPELPIVGASGSLVVNNSDEGTLVDETSSSPSSASSQTCDRQTSGWPEMGEEETPSSSNNTVSASATICYGASRLTSPMECSQSQQTAEVARQTPSMSCIVPTEQRDSAIVVQSQ
eukprot:3680391-Amphidinium_carterae.1